MSETGDPLQKRKTQAIAAGAGINLIFGALLVLSYPGILDPAAMQTAMDEVRGSALSLAYQIATLVVCFLWLHFDSAQLEIRRPWWLNVGIVFLTTVFLAYYLYKTRQKGRRGQAILALLGLICAYLLATMAGVMIASAMLPPTT